MMDISALRERPESRPLTVTELNTYIKSALERDPRLARVSVCGEISNFKWHPSGHLYFSLKDEGGVLACVMFRSYASNLRFQPENGMRVILTGSVSLYVKSGAYQLYAMSMQPDGLGGLYLAYEQLKNRLAAEGLFDETHKLPIPRFPRAVGVITSPSGAAVRDILHITARRFPMAAIYVFPALVQGDGAEADLLRGLSYFEESRLCDCIIIGRGGGSIEDLWAFNSESLARKIYGMTVPVISAVGHETDFTICDFVADLRAPTPSAAAELAVPDARELAQTVDSFAERAQNALKARCQRERARLDALAAAAPIRDPRRLFDPYADRLASEKEKLTAAVTHLLEARENQLSLLSEKAQMLSPLAVLGRGYAVTRKNGALLRSVKDIVPGDAVEITVADGEIRAVATECKPR